MPGCPQCGIAIPEDAASGLCPRCVLAAAAGVVDSGQGAVRRWTLPDLASVQVAFPELEIVERLGSGGMGVVFKARQKKLDRWVALKVLPTEAGADPAFAERFHREARFLARLSHPNIVTVHDFGQSGGFCFLTMEYVDGLNLRQILRAGRLSPSEALAIVPGICQALQYAHEKGVLHRDIKPENILVDAQGRVKLVDFGVAKLLGEGRADVTLTLSGATLGTPHYMAPEQVEKPSQVDHRADIYSLGVVFYEMLTGELPLGRFAAPSVKAEMDVRIDDIVLRALAKERELRQQSAGEVRTQVEGMSMPQAVTGPTDAPTGPAASASGMDEVHGRRTLGPLALSVAITLVLALGGAAVAFIQWIELFHGVIARVFVSARMGTDDFVLGLVCAVFSVAGQGLGIGAAVWNERRLKSIPASESEAPWPRWVAMTIPVLLAAGLLGDWIWLPAWRLGLGGPRADGRFHGILLLAAFALWRRNRVAWWASTLASAGFAFLQLFSIMMVVILGLQGRAGAWAGPGLPSGQVVADALLLQGGVWLFVLGLLISLPVRRIMGMAPASISNATGTSESGPGTVTHGGDSDARRARWLSIGGVMVMSGGLILGYRMSRWESVDASGVATGVFLVMEVGGIAAAVAGTVLGWQALGRRMRGRMRSGLGVAFAAAWFMPGVMVSVVLLVAVLGALDGSSGDPEKGWRLLPAVSVAMAIAGSVILGWQWRRAAVGVGYGAAHGRPVIGMGRVVFWTWVAAMTVPPGLAVSLAKVSRPWMAMAPRPSTALTGGTAIPAAVAPLAEVPPVAPSAAIPAELTAAVVPAAGPPPTLASANPGNDDADAKGRVLIQLARERFAEARHRFDVGAITELVRAAAERDLRVAEAMGDGVRVAEAILEYSDLELLSAQRQFAVGQRSSGDLRGVEATNVLAGIEWVHAVIRSRPASRVRIQSELDAARAKVGHFRQQASVGLLAPEGRELTLAESAVKVGEAQLDGTAAALAGVRAAESARWLRLIEVLKRVGKATDDELDRARLVAGRDQKVLEAILPFRDTHDTAPTNQVPR